MFYILDGLRERIEFFDNIYRITNIKYLLKKEMLDEIENFPEDFLPMLCLDLFIKRSITKFILCWRWQ